MAKILGIDFGTTNSVIAAIIDGEPKVINNKEGARITPSIVTITKNNERLAGVLAKRQQVTNPENTIFSIKRLIGRKFSASEVKGDSKLFPYEIKESSDGGVEIKMGEKWYRPFEISAMILQKLKQDAEDRLGERIEEAIITCPAYFDDSQRKATKVAGEIAGFKVRRVINEPTAAALAYGLNKKTEQQIVVYDFGGGTFDISILDVSEDTVEVKATNGNTHLGGDDFDQKIIDWLVNQFRKDQGIDLSEDKLALQRLKEAAERAKIELSTTLETEINLPFVTSDASGPKHLNYKLSRAKFEEMVKDYILSSIELVKKTLKDAKFETKDIDEIVLVGGQTRMPKIQEEIKKLLGREPRKDINPDEVVALGAAIQAGILQGDIKDVLLLDVIPLSLGIETLGGVNTILIAKNTTIPTSKTQVFSTAANNQPSVEVRVLQGERSMAQNNKQLGRFILDGIPSASRGVPQIEVIFEIDANGILQVSAKDKGTGKEQSVRIEGSCGVSDEEIEKMKKDAELHAEEDKKKKELVEVKNLAETLIYSSEETLREAKDKISAVLKKDIEIKIEELKKIQDSDDVEGIKRLSQELSQIIQEAGKEIYKQQPGQQPSQQEQKEGESKRKKEGETTEEGEITEEKKKEEDK